MKCEMCRSNRVVSYSTSIENWIIDDYVAADIGDYVSLDGSVWEDGVLITVTSRDVFMHRCLDCKHCQDFGFFGLPED